MPEEERLERIWAAIRSIPPGCVASYGQVGEIAGIARGARLVVYALRVAPERAALPWFRVVTASGRIAFAEGSRPFHEQRRRLRAEGVTVDHGRVDMRRFRWQPDLDELLWKPDAAWDGRSG